MGRLQNKVAIITGAGMGMGKAEAILFAREGAQVIVADINEDAGKNVAEEISKAGHRAVFMRLDVSSEIEWKTVTEKVVSTYGKIDILVNNAGILLFKSLEDTTEEDWDSIMRVNSKGVFFGCKHVVEGMKEAGGGSIINISSIYGIIGAPSAAAYEASKGSVRELTKAAAADLIKYNIRVNSIHPGLIDTPMTKDIIQDPEMTKQVLSTTMMRRPGRAEEVAYPVLMLASDESSYMTGAEILVDGGYVAA